jgi:hypothetical protein
MVRTVIATTAAAIAIAVSLMTISIYSRQRDQNQQDINRAVCGAVYKLDKTIITTLSRSRENLPRLAYYKDHPDELARQQVIISREIKAFHPPQACSK